MNKKEEFNQNNNSVEDSFASLWGHCDLVGIDPKEVEGFCLPYNENGMYIKLGVHCNMEYYDIFPIEMLMAIPKKVNDLYTSDELHDLAVAIEEYMEEHTKCCRGHIVFVDCFESDFYFHYMTILDVYSSTDNNHRDLIATVMEAYAHACEKIMFKYLKDETKRMKCAS